MKVGKGTRILLSCPRHELIRWVEENPSQATELSKALGKERSDIVFDGRAEFSE